MCRCSLLDKATTNWPMDSARDRFVKGTGGILHLHVVVMSASLSFLLSLFVSLFSKTKILGNHASSNGMVERLVLQERFARQLCSILGVVQRSILKFKGKCSVN